MFFKSYIILLCAVLFIENTHQAIVKRDVTTTNPLDSLKRNMEAFKRCLDQSLASAVDEVNTKQLQPVFGVIGDQINRVSKAFDDLTAKSTTAADLW